MIVQYFSALLATVLVCLGLVLLAFTTSKKWEKLRTLSLQRNPIARFSKTGHPEFDRLSIKFGRLILRIAGAVIFVIGSTMLLAKVANH